MTATPGLIVEFWVMRAVLHGGRLLKQQELDIHCTPSEVVRVQALINTGDLALLPDGTICEPVEVFADEMAAQAHREKLNADHPGADYRVILNTSAVV